MKKRILTILIAANLALIWGNSLLPGSSSDAVSGGVLAFLGRFLPVLLTESGIVNQSRYRTKTIPSAGALIKEEDSAEKQASFDI